MPEAPDAPFLHHGRFFEDIEPGLRFRTSARTVSETDLVMFVGLAGLTENLFLDARVGSAGDGARGRLVPGALTFALAEGLVFQTNAIQRTGLAFLGMELAARGPVYVGDTLYVVVEIEKTRLTSKGDRGVVTERNQVVNQLGEVVLEYSPSRMIRGRAAATGEDE
ncbi:MaoC family dehydratase N-terminal domain-containing protein [Streptomyces sp. NPDC048254]|uniref:FAS1-like dehydratase domain-containing protein n=1 Tax=Streptomyces sp. NPDC048254 TaxID=3365525 RepID=UPI003723E723